MYIGISDLGTGPYALRVRQDSDLAPPRAGSMIRSKLAVRGRQWRFYTVRGDITPGDYPVLQPGCWSCRCMEAFMIQELDQILPGCGTTWTLSRRKKNSEC